MKHFFVAVLLLGSTAACATNSAYSDEDTTTADFEIRTSSRHYQTLLDARALALKFLNSDFFADELAAHQASFSDANEIPQFQEFSDAEKRKYTQEWMFQSVEETVAKSREIAPHTSIQTYGGLNGWRLWAFNNNLAMDGCSAGVENCDGQPIRLNAYGLKRDVSDIAVSITHEIMHRVGLRHDVYSSKPKLGNCAPPYLIDDIARRYFSKTSGKEPKQYCVLSGQASP